MSNTEQQQREALTEECRRRMRLRIERIRRMLLIGAGLLAILAVVMFIIGLLTETINAVGALGIFQLVFFLLIAAFLYPFLVGSLLYRSVVVEAGNITTPESGVSRVLGDIFGLLGAGIGAAATRWLPVHTAYYEFEFDGKEQKGYYLRFGDEHPVINPDGRGLVLVDPEHPRYLHRLVCDIGSSANDNAAPVHSEEE